MELKEKLLSTNLFIDNKYFNLYVELILTKRHEKILNSTQNHHIIPKYYYIENNIKIDDSKDNIITLLYRDHILAHYYLAMCSSTNEYKIKNVFAIKYLLNGSKLEDLNIDEIDFKLYQKLYEYSRIYSFNQSHTNEINKKISNKLLGRVSPNKGKYKTNKLIKKSKANLNPKNKKLSLLAQNRIGEKNNFYGKHHSEESKELMRQHKNKPIMMISIDTNEILAIFESAKSAAEYLKINNIVASSSVQSRLSQVCRATTQNKSAYGFKWEFVNKV